MLVSEFDFELPPDLIAQHPATKRSEARLLVLERSSGRLTHARVADLPSFIATDDLVVVNDTRVFPARLRGRRLPGGGAAECLLLRAIQPGVWDALVHPGQRLRPGSRLIFEGGGIRLHGEIVGRSTFGRRSVRLWREDGGDLDAAIDALGEVPLPPYIRRSPDARDRERYQTVYARERGSVAAPTAGLHLTAELLREIEARGATIVALTLHVGYGTFQPVRSAVVEDHRIDPEPWHIEASVAEDLNEARAKDRRIIAVGTTTTRTLEAVAATHEGRIVAGDGYADLFIYPGFRFQVAGGLLTNFHLPQSSLLMLVAAFAGRERLLAAYREAVRERYRFYSYGDAMLIL